MRAKFIATTASLFVLAQSASAKGPSIYSHTLGRTITQAQCVGKAMAAALANDMQIEADTRSLWATADDSLFSHQIRCDITGIVIFTTAGPEEDIRVVNSAMRKSFENGTAASASE